MTILKHFKWSFKGIAKIVGVALAGIVLLSLAIIAVKFALKGAESLLPNSRYDKDDAAYDTEYAYPSSGPMGYYQDEVASEGMNYIGTMVAPQNTFTPGLDGEDFEEKSYYGIIETQALEETCQNIAELKAKEYVIFEQSNENEDRCYYQFKVLKENEAEILNFIKNLDPDSLNVSIQTIKQDIEGVDSQLDILQKKLDAIEEILEEAQQSYDVIAAFATQEQNAEALAQIINDKLNAIERLTSERLNLKNQIDWQNQAMSKQLDRLGFTFFELTIEKDEIFDWKNIKNDWKWGFQMMLDEISKSIQFVSLHLVTYLIYFAVGTLYLFLSVFLLKFVWLGIKKIWHAGQSRSQKK